MKGGVVGIKKLGQTVVARNTVGESKGSVFFLHGTCDTGLGMRNWIRRTLNQDFKFRSYKVYYPTAPAQPYNLLDGNVTTTWFNRLGISPSFPEDKISIDQVGAQLNSLIQQEQEKSLKVVVGGFGTGGTMALHLGFRFNPSIAGVFALSSYLPQDSSVVQVMMEHWKKVEHEANSKPSSLTKLLRKKKHKPQKTNNNNTNYSYSNHGKNLIKTKFKNCSKTPETSTANMPKLFMSTGQKDPLTSIRWTHSTFNIFKDCGVQGHLYTFPEQGHEISKSQLQVLHQWIEEILDEPPTEHSKNCRKDTQSIWDLPVVMTAGDNSDNKHEN